jgi:hypothetical protein
MPRFVLGGTPLKGKNTGATLVRAAKPNFDDNVIFA